MKKLFVIFFSALLIAACTKKPAQKLKVGATPTPHAELLELVKGDLVAQGIELEIVVLTDYVTPNLSLNEKSLDANFFQHIPYQESFNEEHKTKIVTANKGGIHIEPMGLYSNKIKSLGELPAGASIAIPNDPTNGGRALLLLQSAGLIKLKEGAGLTSTSLDIAENPQGLKFRELDAAQLPRVLMDVEAAVINGNYAMEAKFNPVNDSLLLEGADSPYVNIISVREGEEGDARVQALINALKTERVKQFILQKYQGGVVAVF